jgi:NAD(P)-dependent dehydrogenase (short-subunit alcohol dehydrogenase family)
LRIQKRVEVMERLNGKVALVTGAARGIGEGIVRAFLNEGACVYLSDINDELGVHTAEKLGAPARYVRLDVRKEQDWASVTKFLMDVHGALDVVVNNAGITGFESGDPVQDPENVSLEAWRSVHETNLDGVFLGCKYAIKAMRPKRTGSIINISSRSGLVGIPGAAAYASSKAAVRNHTKSVALYCAEQGLQIRCNSIHPAAILTPMWEPLLGHGPDREARMMEFVRDTPLRRFGLPEEVAALAVLLASDEAPYITGAELNIDGGLLAGSAAAPSADDA